MRGNIHYGLRCSLVVVLTSLGLNQGLRVAYESVPSFADWIDEHSFLAEFAFKVLHGSLLLAVSYFVSRAPSVRQFAREAGLSSRLTFSGWLLSCAAIGLGVLNVWTVQEGWSRANESAPTHYYAGPTAWMFFVVYTIMLAPFFEEGLMRGFLFHAFRRGFSAVVSTAAIVCIQTYFHWGLVVDSATDFLFLTAGGVALCAIRESTGSTWNCVLFHAAYNAAVLRQWPVCVIGMLMVLVVNGTRTGVSPVPPNVQDQAAGK